MPSVGAPPLIGVSMYRQLTSWWSWERDAALVPGAYLDMVEGAGAQPLCIPPRRTRGPGATDRVLDGLDGLLLIGGGDVGAHRYGQADGPHSDGSSERRDELEFALLAGALSRELPVLAICRGLQVLNAIRGGDLIQHLPDALGTTLHQPRPGAFGPIIVSTAEGSTVRRLIGPRSHVQCSHHQAVDRLGEGLVVTATSDDGVAEAVELPDLPFVVGVQWHPEESGDLRLFEGLVEAATVGAVGTHG